MRDLEQIVSIKGFIPIEDVLNALNLKSIQEVPTCVLLDLMVRLGGGTVAYLMLIKHLPDCLTDNDHQIQVEREMTYRQLQQEILSRCGENYGVDTHVHRN